MLALRHPATDFIMAHLGGGGDWSYSLRVVAPISNIWIDLSGSGIDMGMLEQAIDAVGPERLLWGSDLTMDTGWAKLRYLESLDLTPDELDGVRFRNALSVFPRGALA